jgi:hypothetical protein
MDFTGQALAENFIFAGVGEDELNLLVNAMQLLNVKEGDTVIQEGVSMHCPDLVFLVLCVFYIKFNVTTQVMQVIISMSLGMETSRFIRIATR